jgi:acyl-CoA synthetase (AMP-forming)/AMP-acid ligase II
VLQANGVQPGDHVAVLARNCIEWPESIFAIYKIRGSIVNVNYRYVEEELRYLLDNADPVAIIYQAEYEPLLAAARASQPKLKTFIRFDDSPSGREPQASGGGDEGSGTPGGAIPEALDYETALAGASPERDFAERSDDDVYLLYTGGTTGMPKGVMWRMEDVFYALGGGVDVFTNVKVTSPTALADKINPDAPAGITMLQTAPFMHGAGQFGLMRSLFEGNTAVVLDQFDAERVWRRIDELRINVVGFTGDAMARPLADAYERLRDEIDITCLYSFSSTAAVWSQTLKDYFRQALPAHTTMMDAIGSTEGGMNGFRMVTGEENPQQGITTVQPSIDSVVLDDDLRPMPPGTGKVGRLARGGNIPIGYYKDPEKTAETFLIDADGTRWSVPGDFARLEDDGRITLLGRGSVSINSGGEKIFPEEVEQAIKAHPEVFDVLVVGVPDDRWGETVCALVQPRPGTEPTLDAISDVARSQIAGYKVPRKLVLTDTVPRHANGKPDYRRAKEYAVAQSAAGSA